MKKILSIIMVLVMMPALIMAQPKGADNNDKKKMYEEVQEFKMKFIAQEIGLKEDQQKKFFELYSEMSEKKRKAGKEARELERKLKKMKNPTNEDFEKVTALKNEAMEKTMAIEKEYDKKFAAFLSSKQIFQMKEAEKEFRQKMDELHKYHKQKKGPKKL